MHKKFLIILGILGGFFICFLLCGKHSVEREKIQFASWGSKSEISILKPIISSFEVENPDIKVEFMHIPQNYFQKIHLLFASNTPPDVLFINNHYLPVYANAGLLEPMSVDDNFYRKALSALSWDNKLYAVPRDVSNLVVFYNKDLFRKKGVPFPDSDWTMNDFLIVAQKLTGDGVFGVSFEEDTLFYLPYLMSEGGGILSDDLSRLIIDDENSQRALNFYADLRKKYHVAPLREESASATMAQMFLQEKLAMHISGRWLVPKYREEAKFDWNIVEFPRGEVGSIVPMDASGWAISSSSEHKDSAKKFIAYLSSKENIQKMTQSGLIVPARRDVAESVYFLDGKRPASSRVFLNAIETSKPTPVSIHYKEILDNLKGKNEKLFN